MHTPHHRPPPTDHLTGLQQVFDRPNNGWSGFGTAIAVYPGVLVVGAPLTESSSVGAVSVYMPVELSVAGQMVTCTQVFK